MFICPDILKTVIKAPFYSIKIKAMCFLLYGLFLFSLLWEMGREEAEKVEPNVGLIDWDLISSWVLNLKKLAGPSSVEKGSSFWLNGCKPPFYSPTNSVSSTWQGTQETFLDVPLASTFFFSPRPKYIMYSMSLWWQRCGRHICPIVIACTCIY